MHQRYFEEYDKDKNSPNLNIQKIHMNVVSEIFKGLKCTYIEFYGPGQEQRMKDIQKSPEWVESERRGMKNMKEYKSGETNLVLTNTWNLDHPSLALPVRDNCPIVPRCWMHMSMLVKFIVGVGIHP